jgi:tetratricopeptide (TPR) repeat protein
MQNHVANLSRPSAGRIRSRGVPLDGRAAVLLLLLVASTTPGAKAQSAAELIVAGERETLARRPAAALALYEKAVAAEPNNSSALWRASRELVDLGEYEKDVPKRTALYQRATDFARRAVALTPNDPEAHFHLARAVGRTALAQGPRERVKYGVEVRTAALRCLELDPKHPGALHVMGVWNAEILRLNGVSRLIAKTFLGGQVFSSASWPEAQRYMEASVAVEPDRLVHRLDLARVYRDMGRRPQAREQYEKAVQMEDKDPNDEQYRAEARRELAALKP